MSSPAPYSFTQSASLLLMVGAASSVVSRPIVGTPVIGPNAQNPGGLGAGPHPSKIACSPIPTKLNSKPACIRSAEPTQSQSHNRMLRLICTLCALATPFCVALASLYTLKAEKRVGPERSSYTATEVVAMLGNRPRIFGFDPIAVDLPCGQDELLHYIAIVSAPGPTEVDSPSRSRQLHTGRLVAISGGTPEWIVNPTSGSMHSIVQLGSVDFLVTWRGLETAQTSGGKRSEHRDQTLSTLAELRICLNDKIETREGSRFIAELLATSISEFHLDQEEISWTASAFASYLPPQTTWWNRYGEGFSFDALVQEMMSRKLNRESCRGLHLVMSLTNILKIDRESCILAPEIREGLTAYLQGKLADAVDSQLEVGAWPPLWSRSGFSEINEYTPEDNNVNRVMVTGHMLEWFHMLPPDMKPPIDVVETGSSWVLGNLRSTPEVTVNHDYCPYTHAVPSLYLARFPENNAHGK
jgi:hypothetical protein